MKKAITAVLLCAALILTLAPASAVTFPAAYDALAAHWSPLLYHDVGISYGEQGLEDIPMKIDFDSDWVCTNNWENLEIEYHTRAGYDYRAYLYYSVQETASHYFLTYGVYHPKDESDFVGSIDKHENDMEHILIAIEKDGSQYGALDLLITQAHSGWNYYKPSELMMESSHAKIWIDAGGHAIYKYDGSDAGGSRKDGVVFYQAPSHSAGASGSLFHDVILPGSSENIGNFTRRYEYVLLNFNTVFERNLSDAASGNTDTFANFGNFHGDTHGQNSASATWGGTGFNDKYTAFSWPDPVAFFDGGYSDADMTGMSHEYLYNKNYTYALTVDSLTYNGGNHNIYMDIYVGGVKYASNHSWFRSGVSNGSTVDVQFFAGATTDVFSCPSKTLYIARPYSSSGSPLDLKIEVKRKSGALFYSVDTYYVSDIDTILSNTLTQVTTANGKASVMLKLARQTF